MSHRHDARPEPDRTDGDAELAAVLPLAQAIDEYLDWQAIDCQRSPNTVRAYGKDLAAFCAFARRAGVDRLAAVDRELLRAFQSALGRPRPGKPAVSAPTRHRRLVALRSFLRYCARERWTHGDLGATLDLPKLPRRLPKPLQTDELARATTPPAGEPTDTDLRDRALVAFLLSTGCRISEALTLDRTDWQRDRLVVRGKGDIDRTVVITDTARSAVDRYLTARTDPGPALFISYSRGRIGRRLSVRGAEAICTRLGTHRQIADLHPHRFRHTAGTLVQDELGDPRLTAEYLGHHGLGSVAGYTEISQHRRAEAAEALRRHGL